MTQEQFEEECVFAKVVNLPGQRQAILIAGNVMTIDVPLELSAFAVEAIVRALRSSNTETPNAAYGGDVAK